MGEIGTDDAVRLAERHASSVPLDHPDYRMRCDLRGTIPEGWLFSYRIHCLKDIAPEAQEKFAGAPGFVITRQGVAEDLNWPMYWDAEKRLGSQ